MADETFDSVWDAIEDTPQEAENMRLRSRLMIELTERISAQGWTQVAAAERLGVTQPRVSDLMRGKVHLFSLDALVNMVTAAGLHVEMSVSSAA
ncbi:helix-turn-helix domain-containing protein [Nocardia brasiliensis]|uniref:helix-turn-helix domain-containing protein n=1 Tax=Nocardia brasiliensis TaxID=37326 RepID=UPI0037BB054F